MNKVKLIIFSLDRAAQLDLLLNSLDDNAPDLFDIEVIYKHSNDKFCDGYVKLISEIEYNNYKQFKNLIYLPEVNFQVDTEAAINEAYKNGYELIAFGTDDDILYREIPLGYEDINYILDDKNVACYSLRQGLDTTVETYYKGNPVPARDIRDNGHFIQWCHKNFNPNSVFGYPYSVDLHIFKTKLIKRLVGQIEPYDNPNGFEGKISWFSNYSGYPSYMTSPHYQCAVAVPVNSVSSFKNRAGDFHPQSAEFLNDKFLEGYRIDLDKAIQDCLDIKGKCSHNEIEYSFIKE